MRHFRSWMTLALVALTVALPPIASAQPAECIVMSVFYEGTAFDILADFYGGSYFVALTSDAPLDGMTVGAVITPALCKVEVDEVALGAESPGPAPPSVDRIPVLP